MNEYADILDTVLRDFVDTPAAQARPALVALDPDRLDAARAAIEAPESWLDADDPGRHRLLLRVGGSVSSLEEAADDPAGLAAAVASTLQDYVIDELGRPWPEVEIDGRPAVLEPRVGTDGAAEWGRGEVGYCPVGGLGPRLRPTG